MSEPARAVLHAALEARLEREPLGWFDDQLAAVASDPGDRSLQRAFGLVPRRLGKAELAASPQLQQRLGEAVPGWSLEGWTVADAARVLLLAALPAEGFAARFRALCQTAEVAEAVALYRGLPLYPEPEALEPQVGEGLRTNMRSVFEAIAHGNPWPQRHFGEHRWNHMVLKALFVGSRLAPIVGLEARANPELARILIDFARERRAADRPVPWELWRCVGPFARGEMIEELARGLDSGSAVERQAVALALAASPDPAATQRLESVPELRDAAREGRIGWDALAERPG